MGFNTVKATIDWFCWEVIPKRLYGEWKYVEGPCSVQGGLGVPCICNSYPCDYKYVIDRGNHNPLWKELKTWVKWISKLQPHDTHPGVFHPAVYLDVDDLPRDHESLTEAIRLAIDDWAMKNINTNEELHDKSILLGYNIPDMYDAYNHFIGQHMIHHTSATNASPSQLFALYTTSLVHNLAVVSYGSTIDEAWLHDNVFNTSSDYSTESDEELNIDVTDINDVCECCGSCKVKLELDENWGKICKCVCSNCNSKHDENWIGCEDCDREYCKECGRKTIIYNGE